MKDPASALAELMNQRHGNHAADPPLGAPPQGHPPAGEPPATENLIRSGFPSKATVHPLIAEEDDTGHIESVAALVCELLGARVKPWLTRKLRAWPYVLEDADDLGQLAALAFVEGYRRGRIEPDPEARRHTASSVSAYLWGICNNIFIDTLQRNRQASEPLDVSAVEAHKRTQESSPLQRILLEAPDDDDEARLWEVLAAVRSRCKPQDIVMTYLQGCGFSSGEIRCLLQVSINMPAKAVRRVGRAVREILGLDPADQPKESPAGKNGLRSRHNGHSQESKVNRDHSPVLSLSLLMKKCYAELIQRLDSPPARSTFLREAVAALGPAGSVAVEQSLADRRDEMRAHGDWSWGLLSAQQRRALLLKDAKLLLGAGVPDEGAAQRAALKHLVAELGNIFEELDQALLGDDLDWLLPLAEHLHVVLGIISEFKEMRQRYRALLEAARRLRSPRLEMTARLGLGIALRRLGETNAKEELERAAEIARELDDSRGTGNALYELGALAWDISDYGLSIELSQQSLSFYRAIGDRHGEAKALHGMALNHCTLNEYEIAEELHSQALKIRREIGDRHGEAKSLGNLAVIHGSMGNDSRSAELYEQCRMLCRQLGDRRGEAKSLNGLAILHSSHGEYHAATEKFLKVIEIHQEIGESEAYALACLAEMYMAKGDYARAAERYRQSLDICLATSDRWGEALALCGLAAVHTAQHETGVARGLYWQGLSIYIEIGLKAMICKTCAYASACLSLIGALHPAAVAYYSALHQATLIKHAFNQHEQKDIDGTLKSLEAAVDSGEITAEDLAAWRAEGEAMSLDELGEFVLAALRK